jgi:poly-gamma-glutamate capsule biosynthesis protein CapA/YwtB (metallophosphatase superfamily)
VAPSYAQKIDRLGLVSLASVIRLSLMNNDCAQVWRSPEQAPVVARIAIAGDFLPAGNLVWPPDGNWREQAARLARHFNDVDTTFVNLEGCLDADQLVPRALVGLGQIVSAPAASLEYLRSLHSHAAGIANNHSYDFGEEGVARTKAEIKDQGMVSLGAGRTLDEHPEVFIWKGPGALRVGFWAAAKATSDVATAGRRGIEPATLARGKQALAEMISRGANFRVALLHAGCMRANRLDPEDVRLMESLAQSGFQVVAASHSHRIAGYKKPRTAQNSDAFCFFGLGSIVSGYVSSPLEREGIVVVAALGAEGRLMSLEVRPILLDDNGFGTIPSADDSATILGRFASLSKEMVNGSYEKEFYREVGHGLGQLYLRDAQAAFRSSGLRGLARKATRVRMRHVRRLLHKVTGR